MKMNKKGFTLIEMLVVIAIIAILVAIIIPTVSSATEKAKEAADVANIRSAVAQYEISTLDNPSAAFALPTGVTMNYTAASSTAHGYFYDSTANVVHYNSDHLEGGKDYSWSLAAILGS